MTHAGDEIQLVVFRIGAQHFALNVFQAERILLYEAPSPLPQAPDFLEGMVSYGDASIPLVDMRKRFGVAAPVQDETRTIVLELDQGRIGIVVDAVQDVVSVDADRIERPPDIVRKLAAECISGIVRIGTQPVIILAVATLLSSTERIALEELIVEVVHE
ncbi:MAG TPA: chemotaxis protein CheW [Gemmatimonadales bacterium]